MLRTAALYIQLFVFDSTRYTAFDVLSPALCRQHGLYNAPREPVAPISCQQPGSKTSSQSQNPTQPDCVALCKKSYPSAQLITSRLPVRPTCDVRPARCMVSLLCGAALMCHTRTV